MTENIVYIVYIGDEVLWGDCETPLTVVGWRPSKMLRDQLLLHTGAMASAKFCTTPDGRPVDGFGGADLIYRETDKSHEWWIRGVLIVDEWKHHKSKEETIQIVLEGVAQLYGEWVREPTEQDLKRRGLL